MADQNSGDDGAQSNVDGQNGDNGDNGDQGAAGGKAGGKKEFEQLPDDHPLVKRLEALKEENKTLRPKAKLVDDAENAKKTDGEKIADLTKQVESVPSLVAAALRDHFVELHQIDKDDAELFLTGTTPELMLKQVGRLLEQSGGAPKKKNNVSKEGTPQRKPAENENAQFASSLFGGGSED